MYIMGRKSTWSVATARQHLPRVIAAAAREPQAIYRRNELVAAVVSPAVGHRPRSLAGVQIAKVRPVDSVRMQARIRDMEAHRVSRDVLSLTHFRDHLAARLSEVERDGGPLIITRNGRAAAVVLSPEAYDRLRYHAFVRAKIASGLADVAEGNTLDHANVMRRAKRLLNSRR